MPLMTGAIATPPHRLAAAIPFLNTTRLLGAPPSYGVAPPRLSAWLNDTYGICVTAEEAFHLAAWSTALGFPETFALDADVKAWAKAHRALNGAVIESVLQWRTSDPLTAEDRKTYTDGPYNSVDYTNDSVLSAALFQGKTVKIGVAAAPLERAVNTTGMKSGWALTGLKRGGQLNHCVALCGYGPANDLYAVLKLPLPAGVSPATQGYLLFTWGSIGFVDVQSMVTITGEAWVRMPGITQLPVPAPDPSPGPGPAPQPTPTPIPVPTPGEYPMSGTRTSQRQVGVYLINESISWTATLNDPPPPAGEQEP